MSQERHEIVGFDIVNRGAVTVATLSINNDFQGFRLLPVREWFPVASGLHVNIFHDCIELEFAEYGCVPLVDALNILNNHGFFLTYAANKALYLAFLKVMTQACELRVTKNIRDLSIKSHLNAYQASFYGLHEYFKRIEKIQLRKIIGELSTEQEAETPISKRLYDLFNQAGFLQNQGVYANNFLIKISEDEVSESLHQKIQAQWTAFNSNYIDTEILGLHFSTYMLYNLRDENKNYQLDTAKLNTATAKALQNLIAYAVQLGIEQARKDDQDDDLQSKIKLTSHFIAEIFQQKELTQDGLFEAYEKLEREDINRGTGFYRVHSFFTRKHYQDDDGRKRLVKSTLGELAYDLMQTLDYPGSDPIPSKV